MTFLLPLLLGVNSSKGFIKVFGDRQNAIFAKPDSGQFTEEDLCDLSQ